MMAVNLSKHGSELSDVYNEVVSGNTGTDWVLFTYEEKSYDIKVAATGDGGLDELVEELSMGKVMYGFCRVTDPNLGVPKFILINWTGEGVTGVMRGVCANHFRTMASFLRGTIGFLHIVSAGIRGGAGGAHVTINAYSEDDVEPELIMKKVFQSVGVNYRMQNESRLLTNAAASHPAGSAYRKTSALDEIKGKERENFWAQIEKEEETRHQQERKKAEEERQRAEKEKIQQEERETAERDRRQRERARQIDQQRMQEKKQEATSINQQNTVEQELQAAQWKGIRSSRSVQEANGSKHYKSSALEEINGTDREHFWAQLEKEEKTRRQQERKKAEEERQRAEKERIQQEERETAERDRRQRERVRQIDQQRMQEKKQEATTINQQNTVEQELQAAQWKGIRSSRSVQEANGSKHYKSSALEEINGTDREHFWAQLEKEEETRHQQERKKAEEERQRAEKERIQQEERETAERDRRQRERVRQIDQQRMQEKKQEATTINQHNAVEQELQAAQWKGIRSSRSVQEANGSKHYKSSALEEINGTDREHFWVQLEKEEETRRQQERKKAEEERQRAEKERIQQEERETAERDQRQRERARQIDQQRMQEKKQEATTINQHNAVEQELQAAQWKGIRSSRSVQEANLAAAIISQRAVDPRETFSQKATNFLTNKSSETQSECNKDKRLNENIYDISSNHRSYEVVKDERTAEVKGLYAEALYDYQAADDTEITFDPGDIITVVEMADEGWWHGYGPDGYYGMFPANYVKLI